MLARLQTPRERVGRVSVLPLVLSLLGAMALGDSGSMAAATAVALLVLAIGVIAAATATVATTAPGSRRPDPRRSISPSTLLAQSDPDAPGRRRPRAPGLAAAAA
jgi:hypothetical protein